MGEVKTKVNDASVTDFINSVSDEQRRKDSFILLKMYTELTGHEAKMWGSSIIGFGMYHLKSQRGSQEADWPLAAFSPRKQYMTLYVMPESGTPGPLFAKLGKHKTSKACLYINKLDDVDLNVLEGIIRNSYEDAKARYNTS